MLVSLGSMGWTAAIKTRIMTGPASQVVRSWGHVRPTESAFILAAHLFLSVFPLLLVMSLFVPNFVADIGSALRDRLGLKGDTQQAMGALIGGTQTSGHGWVTVLGLLMALVSATSFTRALQRVYERSWELPPLGLRGSWRGLVWLLGLFAYLETLAMSVRMTAGASYIRPLLTVLFAFLLWWWTPYVLLGGRVRWRSLALTGLISAIVVAILGWVSSIYMPYVLSSNESKYGTIGVVFALESWLAVLCGALVLCAMVGAVGARLDSKVGLLIRGREGWQRR